MWTNVALQFVYWLALPVRGLVIAVLFRRKLVGELPVFFSYTLVSEIADIVRLIVYCTTDPGHSRAYMMAYWLTDFVVSAFALLAVWELFGRRLFSGFQRVSFYRRIFPVVAIPILVAGLVASFVIVTGDRRAGIFVRFVHSFDGLRIAALFFFVALMVLMGRHWQRYELGVAAGLGIDAVGFLVTRGVFLKFAILKPIMSALPAMANDVACAIWLITLLGAGKKPVPDEADAIAPGAVDEAKKTAEALKSLLTRNEHSGNLKD